MALFPISDRDSSVIDRILRGARDDFEILVRRYHASVYALAYSRLGNVADAEDATQESFLKAFRNLATIRDKKKFGAWLMTVARNESTRLGRKRSSRPELDEPSPEIPDMAQRELHQFLRQQIHALDTPHRDVLLLHYFSGLKVREIAVLLQISKAAAGKRLERARATLGEQVIAQLRTGLENERPNRKGENRVMAAVAVIPIPP
jgi:RNA polymerase sigma-70 factor (ECF subfamily)